MMPSFPHPSVKDQAASVQPSLVKMVLLWLLPSQAPWFVTKCLFNWPMFYDWAAAQPQAYLSCFFLLQMTLMGWAVIHSFRNYGPALFTKGGQLWTRKLFSLLLLVPLLEFHSRNITTFSDSLVKMAELAGPGQMEVAIHELHENVWKGLAYGSSWLGVLYFSFFTVSISFCEEAVFSGFACNRLGSKWGWLTALVLSPLCFSVAHLPVTKTPSELMFLFWAGLTYTAIRLISGSVLLAITAHTLINIYVMLPKWVLAWLHFRSLNVGE